MTRIEGFRQILDEKATMWQKEARGLTRPEAMSLGVRHAVVAAENELGNEILGWQKSPEEVFGLSGEELPAELSRRVKLADNSKAHESAMKKLGF